MYPAFDPRVKFGIPAAAGVALAAGSAMNDGTPLESVGAGAAGALGAAAGLKGARALAGKYAPQLVAKAQRGLGRAEDRLSQASANRPDGSMRADALLDLSGIAGQAADAINVQGTDRAIGVGLVPASAAGAALGGMAAVRGAGAVGQMMGIDPEMPGSSNTVNSRLSMQSAMLPMY